MKRTFFALITFLLLLTGCGKSEKTVATEEHSTSESLKEVLSNNWTDAIKLDNGKKWKADAPTREGIQNMLQYISGSETKTLEDYRALAIKLNSEKNNILKQCSMDGPAHDNLHIFLKPLIEKIDYLSNAESVDEARKVVNSIEENLKAFNKYFE